MSDPAVVIDAAQGVIPQFEPLADRLLVRRRPPEARSAGGLHIPPSAMEKINQGEVVSVGPKVEDGRLEAGAVIVFGKYAGDEIVLADEDFVVIREVDVFGVVRVGDDPDQCYTCHAMPNEDCALENIAPGARCTR